MQLLYIKECYNNGSTEVQKSAFSFIYHIDTRSSQRGSYGIIPNECLVEAQTGGDGSHYGYQRVPYRYLAHRITHEQSVIERKAYRGDGDKH